MELTTPSFIRFNLFVKSLFFDPLSRGFDKQSAKMGFNKYHPESSEFGKMVEPLNMFLGYLSFVPLTSPFTSIIAPTRCLHWTSCPSAPPPSMSPLLRPMWGWPTSLRCRSTRRRAELGGGWIVKYWALRKMDMECNNTIDVGTCWNMQSKYCQTSHRKQSNRYYTMIMNQNRSGCGISHFDFLIPPRSADMVTVTSGSSAICQEAQPVDGYSHEVMLHTVSTS